jgi:hypothetical protein
VLVALLHCTSALGITVSYCERSAFKLVNGKFLKLYEIDHWNGTVLNAATWHDRDLF